MISVCNCTGFNFYEKYRTKRLDTCNWRKGTRPGLKAPFQTTWQKDGRPTPEEGCALRGNVQRTINEGCGEHHKITAL